MVPVSAPVSARATSTPRRLHIAFRSGAWHMNEEGEDTLGGIFTSLAAAVAFGRSELRGVHGATLLVDLDGGSYDGKP